MSAVPEGGGGDDPLKVQANDAGEEVGKDQKREE